MKNLVSICIIFLIFQLKSFSQGFEVEADSAQTFSFKDESNRNQATFHSISPFEEINGLTTEIYGKVTFDVNDFANTLKGEITVPVASLRTGIAKMEEDLRSSAWLNEEEYPLITLKIKDVNNAEKLEPNKIKGVIIGDFTVHGVTREISADAEITYLDESERTRERMPGDLLGVTANFEIKLSEYEVDNMILGSRVADNVDIKINMVGTNKF